MKIALITPYANFPGGVETVNQILCSIFRDAGHTVNLITAESYQPNLLEKCIIKVIGLPHITKIKSASILKEYDIVIANGEFAWGIDHPNVINLFHGSYKGYRDYLRNQWTFVQYLSYSKNAVIQRVAARGKYVVAVSQFIKNILEYDGINVRQVINNSVDTELFRPASDTSKAEGYLFVGSYNYYAKGFDVLEALLEKNIRIDCVTNVSPSRGLGWIQNVENEKMAEIYRKYRLLIFPSRFEGMPMAPLEAMACGLPIVMSNVGLGPELKKVIPEFVEDEHNADLYLEKIKFIEANYETYSKKAVDYVLKYHSFDNFKKSWIAVIDEIGKNTTRNIA